MHNYFKNFKRANEGLTRSLEANLIKANLNRFNISQNYQQDYSLSIILLNFARYAYTQNRI